MADLHIGVYNTARVTEILPNAEGRTVFIETAADGTLSSWDEWGEPKQHRTEPTHVVIRDASIDDLLTDFAYLRSESPGLLKPMAYSNQAGVIAAITSTEDWSESYLTITDSIARRGRGVIAAVHDSDIWRHPAWLAIVEVPDAVSHPTPEQAADAVLARHVIQPHWQRSGEQVRDLLIEAITAERDRQADAE